MADGWFKTISRVHRYYVRVKKDYQRNVKVLGGPSAPPGPLSIREGGIGGALEDFKMIEAILKEFGGPSDHDVEMTDAHEQETSKAGSSTDAASIGVKNEIQHGRDGAPARYDQWNAINSGAGAGQYNEVLPASNGSYHGVLTPGTTSPSTTAPVYRPSSGQASPMVSPAFGQHQLPSYPPQPTTGPALQASVSLQQQMQAPPPPLPAPMTAEQTEVWLRSLNTAFTGDDLSAFVEGRDWQTWVNEPYMSSRTDSWLRTIWTGPL
jgi:hypothetical protein